MRAWTGGVALALVAAALAFAPAPAAAVPCAPFVAQDDAGSGRDAGDAPEGAVVLPDEGHFAGWLGPSGAVVARDAQDWYAYPLAGSGETVMVEAYVGAGADGVGYYTPPALDLQVLRPDGSLVDGDLTPYGARNVTVVDDQPGVWLVRVAFDVDDTGLDAACGGAPVAAASASPDYKLYFGCRPYCARLAG